MKHIFLFLLFLISFKNLNCQINTESLRFIEVTGSAEMEVEPDEINLVIGISEFWKEELDRKKDFSEYKTRIPLDEIESSLLKELASIGITKDQITINDIGNYYRYPGKDFLNSKKLELKLSNFSQVDEIMKKIKSKGINYMNIGEMKNKNISEYRKMVKIEALRMAKAKAEYLLNSVNCKPGGFISIIEVDDGQNNYFWRPQSLLSNSSMETPDNKDIDNFKKIQLRYEIKAKFEILNN